MPLDHIDTISPPPLARLRSILAAVLLCLCSTPFAWRASQAFSGHIKIRLGSAFTFGYSFLDGATAIAFGIGLSFVVVSCGLYASNIVLIACSGNPEHQVAKHLRLLSKLAIIVPIVVCTAAVYSGHIVWKH